MSKTKWDIYSEVLHNIEFNKVINKPTKIELENDINEIVYSQEEVTELLHQKWADTAHEMQGIHRRAGEVKRKAVYDFTDAIRSITNDWDDLCDCQTKEYTIVGELNHANECMTMNARHDVEQLLQKFEGRE